MTLIIDTNVIAVANERDPGLRPPECILECVIRLRAIVEGERIALDSAGAIFEEYRKYGSLSGEPGPGDAFIRWVFDNLWNSAHVDQIKITPTEGGSWQEFPADPRLTNFDLSDRKFVAVCVAHADRPPILNAVDSDWRQFSVALAEHGVRVIELC